MRTSLAAIVLVLLCGCVQRTLTLKTDPPGAVAYLNGTEVGRTPLKRDFTWYGVYDVELRKEGYETLKTTGKLYAPWWQWPGIDLLAELMPFRPHDQKFLYYTLHPISQAAVDPQQMVERARQLQGRLQGSESSAGK